MRMSRYRVPCGYLAGTLVFLLARPTPLSLMAGSLLAVLGEAVRLWASGHIRKTQELATGGPYAFSRNPLYVGSGVLALGVAVASANSWVGLAVTAYFLAFYPPVMREEAAFLAGKFPEYADWAREVPLFLPRLTPAGPRGSRFDWAQVRANREWRTALALPVLVILLYARGRLLP